VVGWLFGSRLPAPVEALLTTDAVSSLQDHLRRQHPQPDDSVTDASSDAASELSDEESASVIEVEVGRSDWSPINSDDHQPANQRNASSSSSSPSNSDDSLPRNRTEYIQTAPWRCFPIRHRASISSYSDPDIASSAAAFSSHSERQRLARARQRRHLARSIDMSQTQLMANRSSDVFGVQSSSAAPNRPQTTATNNNNTQQQQRQQQQQRSSVAVVVSRNNYVPQKPPPPLPMPDNELVKQLRPVPTGNATSKPPLTTTTSSSSSSSSSTREPQRPVRELVAQLSGRTPSVTTTTTNQKLQQQQRRLLRRQQLQLLHGQRPLSSSSSDAEADYEILINTPPVAATDDDNAEDNSVNTVPFSNIGLVS